jgi:hypothetical protein
MEGEGIGLPYLGWRRPLSRLRNMWLIRDGETIVAIVDEIGDTRSWIFYWYRNDNWVELIDFGSHDTPVEGIVPRFGEIVEYALFYGTADSYSVSNDQ